MRLDITLSPFDADMTRMSAAAAVAEEAGIGGLWSMDHLTGRVHAGRTTVLECLAGLGALAAATEQVRIGSLVLNPVLRHPVVLAQALASIQEQSAGRLMVGLGAGGGGGDYAQELVSAGLIDHPAPIRRQRVTETIAILHHVWSGSNAAWHGELYSLAGSPGFLVPTPTPPLILGGYGVKMATVAGRTCQGFNTAAAHPEAANLVRTARAVHAAADRPGTFEASAFAVFEPCWIDPVSPERRRLAEADIDVLILVVHAPHDHGLIREIAAAR